MKTHSALHQLLFASATLLAACGGSGDTPMGGDPDTGEAASEIGAFRIGPEGGTIRGDEVEITIPEGALDEEVMIRIRVVPEPVVLPGEWQASGEFYEITPHGLSFSVPITVALPYDGDEDESLMLVRLDDDEDDSWASAGALTFADGIVRFESEGLSFYTVVRSCPLTLDQLEPGEVVSGCGSRQCGPHPLFAVCGSCGQCDDGESCNADGGCVPDGGDGDAAGGDGDTSAGDIASGGDGDASGGDGDASGGDGDASGGDGDASGGDGDASAGDGDASGGDGDASGGDGDAGGGDGDAGGGDGDASSAVGSTSLSAGAHHYCTVRDAGTLWCWGNNTTGQFGNGSRVGSTSPIRIGADDDWASVAPGSISAYQTCALKMDGALWCTGNNGFGQLGTGDRTSTIDLIRVADGHFFESVSVGMGHACGIALDHTLWCWGSNGRGELGNPAGGYDPTQVGADADWAQVSASQNNTCAVKTDGRLFCWGSNFLGQLGLGDTRPSPASNFPDEDTPQQVGADTDWKQVSIEYITACATKTDGRMFCWGRGNRGQLGDGILHTGSDTLAPTQSNGTDWDQVRVGKEHVCAVRTSGELFCWGEGGLGQLGQIGTVYASPRQVGSDMDWSGLAVTGTSTCGMKTDGSVHCWGDNGEGVRGDPAEPDKRQPSLSDNGGGWRSVTGGRYHGCGLKTDDTAHCWGRNYSGQIGNGQVSDTPVVAPVAAGSETWQQMASGDDHNCAIHTDGTLWCWGENNSGQVGNGAQGTDARSPTQIDTTTTWTSIACGSTHSCGVRGGELWCWGARSSGQLGDTLASGTQATPAQSGADTDWAQVCAGQGHACAVKTDGSLHCWGQDGYGQLGNGTAVTGDQRSPMQVGTDMDWASVSCATTGTCARKTDGSLWCWGNNWYGRVGDGTLDAAHDPVQVEPGTTFSSVDLWDQACGISSDGLRCWGYNGYSQVGDGTQEDALTPLLVSTDTDWADVGASFTFTCAVRDNGEMWCWGNYRDGLLARGPYWDWMPFDVPFAP